MLENSTFTRLHRRNFFWQSASAIAAASAVRSLSADEVSTVSEATRDGAGMLMHQVRSPFQTGTTQLRVLLPDELRAGIRLRAVYVLPVEAETENRYGDGLHEIQSLGLHNKFDAIFVAPTFSHLPWYADHPSARELRQESHFLQVVVPFIDRSYPVQAEARGRMLLGFSKSGWGAWSLLLRHPDMFHKAAAWDAPLMMDRPGKYGSGPIFGTEENFSHYRISTLLENQARLFRQDKRLLLLGYGNFRGEHQQVHAHMQRLRIAHEYRDGPARKHDWHSGWVQEASTLLLSSEH
jgi:hypothetical protein